uniref:Taste receptor type 2 n=1 Tax=Peromyscus maniculatus bairdii TaxID=230844 RepID=A0A8C8UCN4_PERMB
MLSAAEGVLLSIATSEAVLGVLGNGFIAFVFLFVYCTRNKRISKTGFILIGLVISSICLVWMLISEAYIKIFSPKLLSSTNIIGHISYLWVTFSRLSFWFATSLSIFYFVKIVNVSHYIFLWLKRRIKTVFLFLIGCLFVSWLFSFPVVEKMVKENKMQFINTSWLMCLKKSELIIQFVFTSAGVFLFFMIMLIRHSKKMQLSEPGARDLNTEVHMKAIKHLTGIAITVLCLFIPESNLLFMFGLTTTFIYPCCHSLILILANSRLKHGTVRTLQQLKCSEKGKDLRSI